MTQDQVAIVIVTYQSSEVIDACLSSVGSTGAEVVVVDNASRDGTQSAVMRWTSVSSRMRLIANAENRGFAAAVNQGVGAMTAPFVLLLNPDAVLESGVSALVAACSRTGTGAAGGKLIDSTGAQQIGFNVRRFPTPLTLIFENMLINRLWPKNPVNWRFRCFDMNLAETTEVDQPAGAFLMFRRDVWLQMDGFDEGFFPLWFEDVDFCKRLRNAGLRIFFEPEAIARHRGGHSISAIERGTKTEYWYCSLLRYSIQHFNSAGRIMTCLSVIAGSALRLLSGGADNCFRDLFRVYRRVVTLAFRSIWKRNIEFGEILSLAPAMRKNSVSNDAK